MIKVLEHGVRKVTCKKCKAKLEYEVNDIQEGKYYDDINDEHGTYCYIVCPDYICSKIFSPQQQLPRLGGWGLHFCIHQGK